MAFGIDFRKFLPGLEDDARDVLRDARAEVPRALDRIGDALEEGAARLRPTVEEDAPAWLQARLDELDRGFERLRDEARPWLDERLDGLARTLRDLDRDDADGSPRDAFDGTTFAMLLDRLGLDGLDGTADIRNLDDIAALAERLPGNLGKPDDTGEVPTGSADIPREQAAVAASLAAAARIVEALGPTTVSVEALGEAFTVAETYRDPITGFSALRLTPQQGGVEVFSIDGLQVGAHADEVAAATLGRLQLASDAFAEMIRDAATIAAEDGREVLFAAPSLGGALAQAASYLTAEALLGSGRTLATGEVQFVTVDGLGGRDAAEWANGGELDPAALELITALNLRTEGDIVSRIGSHVGATRTLPALDEDGREVVLDAGDAHVNTVSLLQTLGDEALWERGVIGAPAEIGGFALASKLASEELIDAWLEFGTPEEPQGPLQIRGRGSFDATGTVWSLDLDEDGTADFVARLSAPASGTELIG